MLEELRQRLRRLEKPPGLMDGPAVLPLGAAGVDGVLGGGLPRAALHEIAAIGEAHMAAATGFAAAVAALSTSSCPALCRASTPFGGFRKQDVDGRDKPGHDKKQTVWIAEDMAALESGALHGPGIDDIGLRPERLITVHVAQRRDLLWTMEEALRCRAVGCVIAEMRHGALDTVVVRRLSLAAAESGALALLLRAAPEDDASTAATRWMVSAAPNTPFIPAKAGIQNDRSEWRGRAGSPSQVGSSRLAHFEWQTSGKPDVCVRGRTENEFATRARFAVALTRNRRGPRGQWILEWSDGDGRFTLAAHALPMAQPPVHRPHRQIAQNVA
jgi:protein ImuA